MSKLQGAISQVTSVAVDFASLAANSTDSSETVAVVGARVGDPVLIATSAVLEEYLTLDGVVTANDVVTLYLRNNDDTVAVDAAAVNVYVVVLH